MWVKKKTGPEIDFVKLKYDVEELLLQVDTPLAVAFLEKFEVDESSAQMEHNHWRRELRLLLRSLEDDLKQANWAWHWF